MKLKEIKKGEEFIFQGHVFTVEIVDGKAKFKFVRKSDSKKSKEFIPPTKTEMMDYAFAKGHESFVGAKAWDYYHEMGWKDKNDTPVKNWKAKMISTWFNEDNKRKVKTETNSEMVR